MSFPAGILRLPCSSLPAHCIAVAHWFVSISECVTGAVCICPTSHKTEVNITSPRPLYSLLDKTCGGGVHAGLCSHLVAVFIRQNNYILIIYTVYSCGGIVATEQILFCELLIIKTK